MHEQVTWRGPLTVMQERAIARLLRDGRTYTEVESVYGVRRATVARIARERGLQRPRGGRRPKPVVTVSLPEKRAVMYVRACGIEWRV